MNIIHSKDNTPIAYETTGSGPLLIIVTGALNTHNFGAPSEMTPYLQDKFTILNYDRRGRGQSGNTLPYSIDKELEDIESLIDQHGGKAFIYGHSAGGALALFAAEKFPEKIETIPIGNDGSIRNYHFLRINRLMGWSGELAKEGKQILTALAKAFVKTDASLLEINPLVKTKDGHLLALDAKLSVDENALYRQPKIAAFYDPTQLPANEVRAKHYDLAYVALDGTIGCMVNGAGLAMATMDIIHYYGGQPANFLDVGGGATQEKVAEGFKIILADPQVKAILVNIFGGIMNCATLAGGIVAAAAELGVSVPLIVRMEGTNVDNGKKILRDSGLNITIADNMEEAAQKAVSASAKH